MCRAGPIGLIETRALGVEWAVQTQAKLLGKAVASTQWLTRAEGSILAALDEPLAISELRASARVLNLDNETLIAAVTSLLRSGLIRLVSETHLAPPVDAKR